MAGHDVDLSQAVAWAGLAVHALLGMFLVAMAFVAPGWVTLLAVGGWVSLLWVGWRLRERRPWLVLACPALASLLILALLAAA